MITVSHLEKTFKTASGTLPVIHDINFTVPEGSFTAIIGKSGSGKSTLLSLLGGLDTATDGSIVIDDRNITRLHDRKLTLYRGRQIGFIFQSFYLIPNLSALENVMMPMEFTGVHYRERRTRATHLLHQVGITPDQQKRHPAKLSGGQQQRVAIARALANQPSVILADEPTGNLDSETGTQIFHLLQQLCKDEGVTIILVTHDLALAKQCDQVLKLKDGRLEQI
ncbi:MAG TPA: ABC transporter ATP-binding protein [Candidatus Saccharimonadales bacterium]|nr:ABC transporter ATP-binding protein [Candidatus Saccharimonadales bacterium]